MREEMKMVALQSCCAETRRFLLTPFEVSSWRKAVSTVWAQYEHIPFLVGTLSFLKGSPIRLDLLKFQYSSWTVNIRNRRWSSIFLEVRNFSHQFLINFFEKYLSCHLEILSNVERNLPSRINSTRMLHCVWKRNPHHVRCTQSVHWLTKET